MFSSYRTPLRALKTLYSKEEPQFHSFYESRYPVAPKKTHYHIEETENDTVLRLAIPGVAKEAIDIEAREGNIVRIVVTRDEHFADLGLATEEKFRAAIGHDFVVEDATTSFENGVLEVRLQKAPENREERKIHVE